MCGIQGFMEQQAWFVVGRQCRFCVSELQTHVGAQMSLNQRSPEHAQPQRANQPERPGAW